MINIKKNTLILIDGTYYLYRFYYAFPHLFTSFGQPIGAMYGIINMINTILSKYKPNYIAIIFDSKGITFRKKIYSNYKINRTSMPNNLIKQIEPIYNIIKLLGLPILSIKGIEADDIIGTIAYKAEQEEKNIFIFSNDKDMSQLVSKKIKIINNSCKYPLGPKEIKLKFGISSKLISDFLALTGDKSDNIPGVPGIGKKIAQILLKNFDGIKILYKNLNHVVNLNFKGAKLISEKLDKYRNIVYLSHKLTKIKTNIEIKESIDFLKIKNPKIKKLINIFKYYELNQLLNKFNI